MSLGRAMAQSNTWIELDGRDTSCEYCMIILITVHMETDRSRVEEFPLLKDIQVLSPVKPKSLPHRHSL